MSTLNFIFAVLHVAIGDFTEINKLAQKVISNGIYANVTLFATPPITLLVFQAELTAAVNALNATTTGGDKTLRNTTSAQLLFSLHRLGYYANGLYLNDSVKLLASGLDLNRLNEVHPRPNKLVISRIVAGADMGTIKIYLTALTGEEANLKETRTYQVYLWADMETQVFSIVHTGTDSRELIVKNVPQMAIRFYSVTATNAAGESPQSGRTRFVLT